MNVFDFIKNYCETHNIKNYALRSCVLTKEDFSKNQSFAPGIAFFYKEAVSGLITNVNQLSEPFLTVQTTSEFWDFSKICKIVDNGTIQHAESDFIFICDNTMNITCIEGSTALFDTIYNAQLFYYYLTVLPSSYNEQQIKVDINKY